MNKLRMKWLPLLLVLALLAGLTAGCSSAKGPEDTGKPPVNQELKVVSIEEVATKYFAENPESNRVIPEATLKERLDANDSQLFVVDIRSAEDYAAGHIKGAVNAPFGKMHEYLDKLPVDKEIVLYCKSGQTAGQTVAIVNMYGYKAVSLNLGFDNGWVKKNNFPVDKTPVEFPANLTPAKPDANIGKILKDYYVNMPANTNMIAAADLLAKINNGDDIQIVDLRKPDDYAKGHVKNAINIPFGQLTKNLDKISTHKPVFVYCYSGQTAGQAVAVLKVLGYDAVTLKGGFNFGWTPEGLPVVEEAA